MSSTLNIILLQYCFTKTYNISKGQIELVSNNCISYAAVWIDPFLIGNLTIQFENAYLIETTMKSFKKQLQQLFAYAGYKTNGIYLTPKVQCLNSSSVLTYKIDVAHQLYQAYQQQQFKYSQKGVTPKLIAEQMSIYLYPSDHINIQIDSFGYFLITPSIDYFEQMAQNMRKSNSVCHTPLSVKNLKRQDWVKKVAKTIIYQIDILSLSNLRIVYYLEKIAKKYQLLRQFDKQSIFKIVDCQLLQQQQVQLLLKSKLIVFEKYKHKLVLDQSIKKQKINSPFQNTEISDNNQLQTFKPNHDTTGGCLRHRITQYNERCKNIASVDSSHIQIFGQIFPNISLDQIYKIYPEKYRQEIQKIMQYTLKFETKVPINLRNIENNHHFAGFETQRRESDMEQLLVFLDYLGEDKLIEANWKLYQCRLKQSTIYRPFFERINHFFGSL